MKKETRKRCIYTRKLGVAFVLALSLSFGIVSTAFADNNGENSAKAALGEADFALGQCIKKTDVPFETPIILDSIGGITIKQQLIVEGESFDLLPTFDDPTHALTAIKEKASTVLSALQKAYGLEELSGSNWKDYYEGLTEMLGRDDCPEWYSEDNHELMALRAFFDIYENDEDNADIRACAEQLADAKKLHLDNEEEAIGNELALLLPDQSILHQRSAECDALIDSVSEVKASTGKAMSGYNTTKAISYAKRHATSINSHVYAYFKNGDCTNFASQILEQAGIKQVPNSSVYKGWWHKRRITPRSIAVHTHSNSWTVADTFCRYMGVGYKTRNHVAFSKNIKAGDFIAADWTSDGRYDHVGFVAAKGQKTPQGYYDYLVAQHTSNYLRWASSSGNGWDQAIRAGGTLARIRR